MESRLREASHEGTHAQVRRSGTEVAESRGRRDGVDVEGKNLALVNLKGEIYALDDSCPHEAGPLSEGRIVGEDIECPSQSGALLGIMARAFKWT